MPKKLDVIEIEYSELSSLKFSNFKFGLRIRTTPQTYDEDFATLVAEVKTRLHMITEQAKPDKKSSPPISSGASIRTAHQNNSKK